MKKVESFLRELVETVLLSLVLFFLVRTGVENYKVYGSSMEPNFYEGEYIMVNRLAYYLHPPQRGDVVVFRYPKDFRRTFIKRVIALPGETVEIKEGKVYVNGQPLMEPYPLAEATYSWGPATVGPEEVFVLGDNRNFSSDSHSWGMLPIRYIVGKAWFCYWPPNRWRIIPPYRESAFLSPISTPEGGK